MNITFAFITESLTIYLYSEVVSPDDKTTINFILMTRKGSKQQYKSLEVSVNSELAINLKDREQVSYQKGIIIIGRYEKNTIGNLFFLLVQAERVEKERVKRLTLDINERQEEEDYQEMLAAQQRPAVMNLNRERRQKYQHPKGAPDADLIFGNKQVFDQIGYILFCFLFE